MLTPILWTRNAAPVPLQKVVPVAKQKKCETNVAETLAKIDAIMSLQIQFMELGERAIESRRLQLLWVIMQASTVIVFNVYHLLMFSMRLLMEHPKNNLNITEALLYYGHPIISELVKLVLTIICISLLKQSFHKMLRHLNKFNIYAHDISLRQRLFELSTNLRCNLENYTIYGLYALNGTLLTSIAANTLTYIVILLQYSMGDVYTNSSQ